MTDAWQTVALDRTYTSMVVVCTPGYDSASVALVPRLQNATGGSFDLRVDQTDGLTDPVAGVDVHCLVVEEGVYTVAEHGVAMEAVRYTSSVTDHNQSWVGENRTYAGSYTSPVVVGQVMTFADADFSVFWARGSSRRAPPSTSALWVGKNVGEDPDRVRADEIVGYVVIESGTGAIDGVPYAAGLGADSVRGVGNGPPYVYALAGPAAPTHAVLSQSAMDGANGGWPVLYGPTPVRPGTLHLAIDEDQARDSERRHTTEQVAYIVFGANGP